MFRQNKSKTNKKEQHKQEKRMGFLFIIISTIVVFSLTTVIYNYNHAKTRETIDSVQINELNEIEIEIQSFMKYTTDTLLVFSEAELSKTVLSHENDEIYNHLTNVMYQTARFSDIYQQMRLLSADGMEVIRIDKKSSGEYKVLDEAELQNKSDRYYVNGTINYIDYDFYLSAFDLNIEHGEIEIPHKPMIRIGKRIQNSSGDLGGLVILNINASKLIEKLKSKNLHLGDQLIILNSDGYYLINDDSSKLYSFMFPGKEDEGFFNDHPQIWKDIKENNLKAETKDGLYYIKKTNLIANHKTNEKNNTVYIIMHIPRKFIKQYDRELVVSLAIATPVILILTSVTGWYLGIQLVRNKFNKEELIAIATRDELTGLYNRHMIFEKLKEMIAQSRRQEYQLAVVFIDVNNLKKVNDTYGHIMGDIMLISASESLKANIRDSDVVARLGGDEFLLVLPDCSKESADVAMERSLKHFEEEGIKHVQKKWYMSYGCTLLQATDTPNTIVHRADILMYEDKRIRKAKQALNK